MDNLQKINETINNHKDLIRLTRQKIEILEEHDSSKYYTGHGIDEVDFEEDMVKVLCFEGCYGYREYLRFEFPISYLLLSDDELIREVENSLSEEKKKEKEKQLKKQEQKKEAALKRQIQKEERERKKYEELKEKYEKISI